MEEPDEEEEGWGQPPTTAAVEASESKEEHGQGAGEEKVCTRFFASVNAFMCIVFVSTS